MWFYRHICAWFSPTNRYFHLLIETLQGWSELSSTEGSLYVKSQSYIPVCPIGPLIAHSSTWIVKYPEKYHCLRVWESMPKDMTSSHPYEHVVCSFSYWSFYWKLKTLHSFSASNLQDKGTDIFYVKYCCSGFRSLVDFHSFSEWNIIIYKTFSFLHKFYKIYYSFEAIHLKNFDEGWILYYNITKPFYV